MALDGHLVQFAIDTVKAYIMSTPLMATESAAKSVTCDNWVPTILGGTNPAVPCATYQTKGCSSRWRPHVPPRLLWSQFTRRSWCMTKLHRPTKTTAHCWTRCYMERRSSPRCAQGVVSRPGAYESGKFVTTQIYSTPAFFE